VRDTSIFEQRPQQPIARDFLAGRRGEPRCKEQALRPSVERAGYSRADRGILRDQMSGKLREITWSTPRFRQCTHHQIAIVLAIGKRPQALETRGEQRLGFHGFANGKCVRQHPQRLINIAFGDACTGKIVVGLDEVRPQRDRALQALSG
jgi:hypothetical protein